MCLYLNHGCTLGESRPSRPWTGELVLQRGLWQGGHAALRDAPGAQSAEAGPCLLHGEELLGTNSKIVSYW